jgi:hypothetical protein
VQAGCHSDAPVALVALAGEHDAPVALPGDDDGEIARRIEQVYGVEPRGEGVSSIVWRMWKRGQLLKDADTPRYGLPDNEKPADEVSRQDASAGLFSNVHGREAVEGGGT